MASMLEPAGPGRDACLLSPGAPVREVVELCDGAHPKSGELIAYAIATDVQKECRDDIGNMHVGDPVLHLAKVSDILLEWFPWPLLEVTEGDVR